MELINLMKQKNNLKTRHRVRQLLRWEQAILGRAAMLSRQLEPKRTFFTVFPKEGSPFAPFLEWIRPQSRAPALN